MGGNLQERDGVFVDVAVHDGQRTALLGEGKPTTQQLVEHHPGGVDVGRWAQVEALGLLGRHVRRRAEDLAGLGGQGLAAADHPGDAEVGDLEHAFSREEEVLGLHVPVQHAVLVGVLEPIGGGHGDRTRCRRGEAAVGEVVPDRPPRKLLHHQQAQAVPLHVVVDGDDVGVGHGRQHPGLGHEAGPDRRVRGQERRKLLDGDFAAELAVAPGAHHAEAATTELFADLVLREQRREKIDGVAHRDSGGGGGPSWRTVVFPVSGSGSCPVSSPAPAVSTVGTRCRCTVGRPS